MSTTTTIPNVCRHGVYHAPGLLACAVCFPPTPRGWQCPRYQRVYAPHVDECASCRIDRLGGPR